MNDDLLQRLWDYHAAVEESITANLEFKTTGAGGSANDLASGSGAPYAGVGGSMVDGVDGVGRVGGVDVAGIGTSRRTLLLTAAASVTVLGGLGWALLDRTPDRSKTAASSGTTIADTEAEAEAAATAAGSTQPDLTSAEPTAPATDPLTVPPTATPIEAPTAAPSTLSNTVDAVPVVPLTRSLKEGTSGDDVARLKQRLKDLHLEPGDVAGSFSHLTTQAVWAFQKLVLQLPAKQATGVVTADVWAAMQGAVTLAPRKTSTTDTHVEVYVPEQVLVVFQAGAPVLVSHVSTGSGQSWKAAITLDPGTPDNPGPTPLTQHILGTSITPGGSYKVAWRFTSGDGWRTGKLGKMYKPHYFNQGVAVHGMTDVPSHPASHGCVRLPMGATDGQNEPKGPNPADLFSTLVRTGDQIFVFTATNPTAQGNEAPPYDKPDPAFTTTAPPTTTAPTTTTAAPATTPPVTTTPATTTPAATTPAATSPPATAAAPAATQATAPPPS